MKAVSIFLLIKNLELTAQKHGILPGHIKVFEKFSKDKTVVLCSNNRFVYILSTLKQFRKMFS